MNLSPIFGRNKYEFISRLGKYIKKNKIKKILVVLKHHLDEIKTSLYI